MGSYRRLGGGGDWCQVKLAVGNLAVVNLVAKLKLQISHAKFTAHQIPPPLVVGGYSGATDADVASLVPPPPAPLASGGQL